MPKVNPKILSWARETAGLTLEEAVIKLGMQGEKATSRLAELESGDRDPSRAQLLKMSDRYRRPLLSFYLADPPHEGDKGQDFRTLPAREVSENRPVLEALLRDVCARQGLVRAALEEADEAVPLNFVGSCEMADGINAVLDSIQRTLDFSLDEFRAAATTDDAFKILRASVEKAGVFVLLIGNLGSYHTDIDASVFRGFALADEFAPFVVINEKDSRAAWSFTLLHELTHIWLGETGTSAYEGQADLEKFCDLVSAQFLLNHTELDEWRNASAMPISDLKDQIAAFSSARNLSRKMVAYNLLSNGQISRETYRALTAIYDDERVASQAKPRESGSGPNYYVLRRHRVGPALVAFVGRMVSGGELSTPRAATILGVKPTNVERVVNSTGTA